MTQGRVVVLLANTTTEYSRHAVFDEGTPTHVVYEMVQYGIYMSKSIECAVWVLKGPMAADGDAFRELSQDITTLRGEKEIEEDATDNFGSAVGFF